MSVLQQWLWGHPLRLQKNSVTNGFTSPFFARVSFHAEKRRRKKRGRKKRISKQRRYAVSKQRTMVSGLAMVYLVLSALTERERARAGKN